MKNIKIYIFLGLMAILGACEETVRLDLEQTPPIVTIEGLVTNEEKRHFVKLSRSVDFYQGGVAPAIVNAVVTVSTKDGRVYQYAHNPENDPMLQGCYFSESPYLGEVGETYLLEVVIEEETYTAQDELMPVTSIDSLQYAIDEDEFEDPEDEGRFYEVLVYAKEPQERKDYYLVKFFRNGKEFFDAYEDIYYADDEIFGEDIAGLETPGFYAKGDTAGVAMLSITRNGFLYYNDLFNLLNNDGGMFTPPPVNPRTNLSGGALGYFQASAVSTASIVVDP